MSAPHCCATILSISSEVTDQLNVRHGTGLAVLDGSLTSAAVTCSDRLMSNRSWAVARGMGLLLGWLFIE